MAREGYRTVMLTAAVDSNFPGERAAFPKERADKLVEGGKAEELDKPKAKPAKADDK